jgi:hypothetical protein
MNGWQDRHLAAIIRPNATERPMVNLISAWVDYAAQHARRFDSKIGDDGVLGPEWAQIGAALHGLLNGETGRLDCGTLDAIIHDNLTTEGFNPDDL